MPKQKNKVEIFGVQGHVSAFVTENILLWKQFILNSSLVLFDKLEHWQNACHTVNVTIRFKELTFDNNYSISYLLQWIFSPMPENVFCGLENVWPWSLTMPMPDVYKVLLKVIQHSITSQAVEILSEEWSGLNAGRSTETKFPCVVIIEKLLPHQQLPQCNRFKKALEKMWTEVP